MTPKSIAVVGASTDPQKTAGKPIYYLQKNNYSGKIFPINPRAESIAGLQCYPDIASLPETPDVAIILVGTDLAIKAVQELAKINTPVAIVTFVVFIYFNLSAFIFSSERASPEEGVGG